MFFNPASQVMMIVLCAPAFLGCGCTGENRMLIRYRDIVFHEQRGAVTIVTSDDPDFCFRLNMAATKIYRLSAITEADAKLMGREERLTDSDTIYRFGNFNKLYFRNGKPRSIHIQGEEVHFAKSPVDPFIHLPTSRGAVMRAFGEPIGIEPPFPSFQ